MKLFGEERKKRDEELFQLYDSCAMTVKQLAERFKISKSRIRQIVREIGLERKSVSGEDGDCVLVLRYGVDTGTNRK